MRWKPVLAAATGVLLASRVPLSAHPMDEEKVLTDSRFEIQKNRVNFTFKFPIPNLVDLEAKTSEEYDQGMKEISNEKGIQKIKAYAQSHLLVFDGKAALSIRIDDVRLERDALSVEKLPRFAIVSGVFQETAPIRDIYIFNEFFKEGKLPQVGESVIQWGKHVYDFQFRDNRYFHLNLVVDRNPSAKK